MIPMSVVFFVSSLAETNRPPFDLPEAESELVAGYQVEYSSSPYMLFYLAETLNIMFMCCLISVLFFGGWQAPFPTPFLASWSHTAASLFGLGWLLIKALFFFFMFAMVRAIVPRYRYDQLMRLGWKVFLPISLVAVVAVSAWRVFAGA
jgi:NADH-quinone oxidoreductase subunit H